MFGTNKENSPFNPRSIKFHLILLVLVTSIPFCVILLSSLNEQRTNTLSKVQHQTKSLVLNISSQQEEFIAGAHQLFRALAQIQEVRDRQRASQLNRLLSTLVQQNPQYANIVVTDREGTLVASALPFRSGLSIADRRYFRQVIQTKRVSVGEYVFGRTSKKPILNFGYPVLAPDGSVQAIIVIAIDLEYLRNVYKNYLLPEVENAAIFDHDGILLYLAKEPEKRVGKPLAASLYDRMRRGPAEGTFSDIGIDGSKKLFFYKKLFISGESEPYMYVYASFSERAALDSSRQSMLRNLAKFGLVFSISLICALLTAKYKIANKVETLLRAIRGISKGEAYEKVGAKVVGGEFGLLAEAFDEMHDQIEAREAEREQAARELLQSHERLLTVLDSMEAIVYVIDLESHEILFANRYVQEQFGNVVGAPCWKSIQVRENGPCEQCRSGILPGSESAGAGVQNGEFQSHENGRWYAAHGREVRWIDERLVRLQFAFDITERKGMEEERLKMETQLLHTQKLESLGVLAGGIAHDFNNLLTVIIGHTNLALMRLSPDSAVIENLERVEKAALRATDLAKQMLAYSGRGKFVIEPVHLNQLIEEMRRMLEISISKKAAIAFIPGTPLPAVEIDATQIRQVIMNLVINASEAMGEKTGSITIKTGTIHCDRTYLKQGWMNDDLSEGCYVFLEVADDGCGMGKETLAKLFEPFFTTKFTGRGLGMSAVQGIIRGHKGGIRVYSEPGKGTTFRVLLPTSEKQAEQTDEAGGGAEFRGEGTILLVDDEQEVLDTGAELLRGFGFAVIPVSDPREAIEKFKAQSDLFCVILDLTMPHLDGIQLHQELMRLDPKARVILSSGYSETEIAGRFGGSRLSGFIQKPYNLSVLREVLSSLGSRGDTL